MLEQTYLKETDKVNEKGVISFEGDLDDIYRVIDFVNISNAVNLEVEKEYYRGFGKKDMWEDSPEEVDEASDMVDKPSHYRAGKIETIEKIESVINGLPAKQASCLANVLKYFDRAGLKDDAEQDLDKANNYAHRLVYGTWRYEH